MWLARLAGVGLSLLFVVPMALAGLTAATYLGAGHSPRRTAVDPHAARRGFLARRRRDPAAVPCRFPRRARPAATSCLSSLDASKSMTIQDESSQSRWDAMLQALHDAGAGLGAAAQRAKRPDRVLPLRGQRRSRFRLDNPGAPDGKRTDIGGMLKSLYEQYSGRRVRGVLVLSDGRNNGGQRIDPFAEARRWRRLRARFTLSPSAIRTRPTASATWP